MNIEAMTAKELVWLAREAAFGRENTYFACENLMESKTDERVRTFTSQRQNHMQWLGSGDGVFYVKNFNVKDP